MGSVEEVSRLLTQWEEDDNAGNDVTPVITRLAEIFELETQNFLKQDPDPFDDRHPSRSQPDCTLGHILKSVFRHQRLVDEIVKVYCQRDVVELNTAVSRFLLDILPGLESVIFQEEGFVSKLFQWAENAPNPLQSYATCLLGAAMDVPEIASSYREKNAYFVPLMLKRLYELSQVYLQSPSCDKQTLPSPQIPSESQNDEKFLLSSSDSSSEGIHSRRRRQKSREQSKVRFNPIYSETTEKPKRAVLKISPVDESNVNENSNSTWTQNMLGSYQVFPLTLETQQRYIFQYLTPMGEYQELIGPVFEESALTLTLRYIDLNQNRDVRLAFEALKYLASLLNHKKIAIEFINIGGLQLLLKVPRSSIAATGVSFCLYYLGYLEEAFERICMGPPEVMADLVRYALWLLECSHDSSRCHATLFFGFALAFKKLLQHFDQQDGLRKLFNVMSTLDIFVSRNNRTLSDDELYANRLTTKHVCGSVKRYFEAHLSLLVEEKRILASKVDVFSSLDARSSPAMNLTSEVVEKNIEMFHDLSLVPLQSWKPVNEFVNLDGVTFLLEMILSYFDVNFSGKAETIKNAVDVLKICALTTSTQLKFCENIPIPNSSNISGISILLQVAEQQFPVADVQRAALLTIINCVWSKVPSADTSSRNNNTPKRKFIRQVEDLLNNIERIVRIKNGIIILINLLAIRVPLTEADAIRALACKALCGLARSQNVKQIINKLPLITEGQLIDLMKEPVLQDKYHDHVQFCKYGHELIARVTGLPLSVGSEMTLNSNKISVSEVVAKTKVIYPEDQLLQLISDHLTKKGFYQTVHCLKNEMDEKSAIAKSFVLGAFPSHESKSVVKHLPVKDIFGGRSSRLSGITSTSRSSQCSTPPPSSANVIPCSSPSSIPPPSVPLRLVLKRSPMRPDIKGPPCRLQKPQMCTGNYIQSPAFGRMKRQAPGTPFTESVPAISLDLIVTEYLRKQHSLCKNPVLACPPFDLFVPHKCPEPHCKRNAPINSVLRMQKREICFQDGGYKGASLNTKHIYSRFRLHHTCRDEDGRCSFSTSAFVKHYSEPFPKMLLGTNNGKVKVFSVNTAKHILTKDCHLRGIYFIDTKQGSSLFITCDGGRLGNSTLWEYHSEIDLVHNFDEINQMEFGKRNLEKLIGSKYQEAIIFDTNTCAEVQAFRYKDLGNDYVRNRATFDYMDELVLTDGLIYDVRSGQMVFKLDKFNAAANGVFHPNGREIISNSEIWDVRTFKLLRTVVGLDACRVTFNQTGNVIYAVPYDKDSLYAGKMNCFYTFDANNYNTIATVDVKKRVFHVATDVNDQYISVIESINPLEYNCRLYEVGRTKQAGDENGDESEDSDDDDNEEDDDDDDESDAEDYYPREPDNSPPYEEEMDLHSTSDSSDEEALFSLNMESMEDD